jgi:hypothetical protein
LELALFLPLFKDADADYAPLLRKAGGGLVTLPRADVGANSGDHHGDKAGGKFRSLSLRWRE